MAKPEIDDARWAQAAAALKAVTTSTQWELGWTVIDGVEQPPILNYQNYWQNAVQLWIEWFDSVIPDLSETAIEITDLYEWTTGHQDFSKFPLAPVSTTLQTVGTDLSLEFLPVAAGALNWDEQINDTIVGARHYEMWDIFTRGLGLRVNDGNGDVWTIYPVGTLASTGDLFIKPGVDSVVPVGGLANLIDGTSGNFVVLKNDVVQSSPRFATFQPIADPIDGANAFSAANPNGWRVILPGTSALALKFLNNNRGLLRGITPRAKWIRPLDVARVDAVTQTTQSCQWPIRTDIATKNTVLKVTYSMNFNPGTMATPVRMFSKEDFTSANKIANLGLSASVIRPSVRGVAYPVTGGGGFTGLALDFSSGKNFNRLVGDVDLPTIYTNFYTPNFVIIEELY